jgi:hypothetical protein
MPRGEGQDFEFRGGRGVNPYAVQPSYTPTPVASPLAVQPSYAPMGGDYNLSPEVLAQLADLGVNPYGEGQAPMSNPVSSPLAVRGMPEMDPAEFSSLAVPGVPAAVQEQAKADLLADPNVTVLPGSLDDLSRFGGLGGLDGYEANSSGAPQGMPTSYAFPENYGNPKNKIYNLTAGPEDNIRLKLVDGTTIYEGQGPEAAAKAAAMVQQLGKDFGTQSTWILDKQTAGGDWKQVSQDTVGEKKKTALNSFLDVVAPIAGAALAFVPGIGPVLLGMAGGLGSAGAAAIGAAGGSLLNSGLQNQNSAEAFKKAAIAAGTTFIGAKIAPNVTSAFKGLTNTAAPLTTAGTQAVTQGGAGALTQAGTSALLDGIPEIVVTGARKGLTALGGGFGAGAGSTLTKTNFNPDKYKVDEFKVEPRQTTDPVIDELVVTGTKTTPIDKLVSSTGSAFTGSDFGKTLRDTTTLEETPADTTSKENEIVVTAADKFNPLTVAGAGVQVPANATPTGPIDELVVTAKKKPQPEKPFVPTPVILPDGTLNPDFVNKDFTVDNPEGITDTKPKNPLDLVKDVLPYVLPLVGGAAGGSGGSGGGYGGNTLSYPGGNQPGTPGSLGGVFTSKLPTSTALAVTPRDMGKRDWLRYGFGPEASFFSNVPDRQALAVNPAPVAQTNPVAQTSPAAQTSPLAVNPTPSPVIEEMPALSEKLNEPAPDLMVKPDTQTASVPADGTMLNGNPSIVWNGGVNGGWMQTERGMIQPDETLPTRALARGGRTGGTSYKPRSEFAVHGAGTGRSDDIPAVLSDGEYVMDAETVALLGDGSSKAGAKKLDELRVNLRRHKGANLAKGRFSVNAKSPEKYLAGGRV